ncbi:hypothetical protein M8J75_003539 [Diaphorina citri]|nr:hypothetical protein M8J75_003539 [Diaphorina citri]
MFQNWFSFTCTSDLEEREIRGSSCPDREQSLAKSGSLTWELMKIMTDSQRKHLNDRFLVHQQPGPIRFIVNTDKRKEKEQEEDYQVLPLVYE